ncbi:MAG: peptidylprolyl isomerase [Microbacteriaceae bacterium]|nr:peptidylprolyl isomerase [Microbacteriaceae bacterium]
MRKTTAIILAIGLLGGLTACAGSDTVAGCTPGLSSGDASSVVTSKGAFGKAPKITFPTPLHTTTSQRSVVIDGKGAALQAGQPVVVDVTLLNATSGDELQVTDYAKVGGSLVTLGDPSLPAVSKGLECAQVGSRVVIIGSPKDSHNGTADAANGIAKDDAFIYVIDIKSAFKAKADGADQVPQPNLPAVVTTQNGTPGITVPHRAAPKKLTVDLLKAGSGAKVAKDHYAVVKFTGISWTTPKVFDSNWKTKDASIWLVNDTQLSTGLTKALTGQRVGSQVLVIIPPADSALPDGSSLAAPPTDGDAVYVVDILGVAK